MATTASTIRALERLTHTHTLTLDERSHPMGFFSANCKSCGQSIKAPYALPAELQWQNEATALLAPGSAVSGSYSGYGDLEMEDGREVEVIGLCDTPPMWHTRCWVMEGCPTDATTPSEDAADQGYFFDADAEIERAKGVAL